MGADVILIPEIPYDEEKIAEAILQRSRGGKRFSIVAVSEGAMSVEIADRWQKAHDKLSKAENNKNRQVEKEKIRTLEEERSDSTTKLTQRLEKLTGLESRVTILDYLQRGGAPSAADRLLATRLGTACAHLLNEEHYGVMVAAHRDGVKPVPLEEVAGKRKVIPADHPWIESARAVGTCLGD